MASSRVSRANIDRMRAKRSTRHGSSSCATSLERFHTQPTSWTHRRTVSAETVRLRVSCSVRASVAQLPRVRHHPYARGDTLRRASRDRRSLGHNTGPRLGGKSGPLSSALHSREPSPGKRARCGRRGSASSPGRRRCPSGGVQPPTITRGGGPARSHSARRSAASSAACSSCGRSRTVGLGRAGWPR